jgi:hypothetical protein
MITMRMATWVISYLQMGDLAHAEDEYSRSYELWPSEDTQKDPEAVRKRKQSEVSKPK